MAAHLRCPMCGRPLHRVPGLERDFPHTRGRDCPEHHGVSTPAEEWERARLRHYRDEIEAFLNPRDDVTCPEHQWTLIELNSTIAVIECRTCASMSTIDVQGLM